MANSGETRDVAYSSRTFIVTVSGIPTTRGVDRGWIEGAIYSSAADEGWQPTAVVSDVPGEPVINVPAKGMLTFSGEKFIAQAITPEVFARLRQQLGCHGYEITVGIVAWKH